MSTFDAERFLNSEHNTSTDTKIIPIPEGDYSGQVSSITARQITGQDGTEWIVMDISWAILDEGVQKETGLTKPTARQSIFLDMTSDGAIDMSKGKNRQLGLLREAVGQNKDGKPWSPGMLDGQMATVKVTQSPDKNDPENIYSNVTKVASA